MAAPDRKTLTGAARAFSAWRKRRPFTAACFVLAAAFVIVLPPYWSFKVGEISVAIQTNSGSSAVLIGFVLTLCGASLIVRPAYRVGAGLVTIAAALIAIVMVNLGSFMFGTTLGMIGGSLALAWTESKPRRPQPAKDAADKPSPVPRRRRPAADSTS